MDENLIAYYVNKCLQTPFPLPHQNINVQKEFSMLLNSESKSSKAGMKLVYKYHPSLWVANKENRMSPYCAWHDVNKLTQVVTNRLKYKGEVLTPEDILYGFSTSYIAPKVSLFRPALAKYLIETYLSECASLFDPCSGYSGRLLGAAALDKNYIGQDINPITVKESNLLINDLHLNATVVCKNSLATGGEYECLFTCPPYGNKENWNQSIEPLSCDEWIDMCLKNYKCKKYLFVVDETARYKEYVVEYIRNKSHLNDSTEKIILITNN